MARSRNSCGYFLGAGITIILSGNQALHEPRGASVRVEGQVADLVDDQQPVAAQSFQFVLEPAVAVRGLQPGSSPGGCVERDRVAGVMSQDLVDGSVSGPRGRYVSGPRGHFGS